MSDFVPFRAASRFLPQAPAPVAKPDRPPVEPVAMPMRPASWPEHGAGPVGKAALKPLIEAPPPPPEAPPVPSGPSPEEVAAQVAAAVAAARQAERAKADRDVAAAKAEAASAQRIAQDLAAALELHRQHLANEAREHLGALMVVGLERLVGEVPDLLAAHLRARCAEVAEHLVGAQNVVLRVHPRDAEQARSFVGDRDGWRVVADARLTGGCIAESDGGSMDASLSAAMEGLRQAVSAWQAEGSPGGPSEAS
jgi:flagellar biosynthesis/type III secretory pathway protein FliH